MKCYACGKLGHISRYVAVMILRRSGLTFPVIALLLTVDHSTLLARLATSAVRPDTSPETVSIVLNIYIQS
jgi:hypothetical protein